MSTTDQKQIIGTRKKDRREGKGRVIALSRVVYHITGKDVFYVESETQDNHYYYIMWNTAKEVEWCSCLDHSSRGLRCKHIYAVEYSIRMNTIKETDHLPSYKKVGDQVKVEVENSNDLQYKRDEYDF